MFRSDGFSIVEVLVSMGVMSIVAIAGLKLYQTQSQSQQLISSEMEAYTFFEEVKSYVLSRQSCGQSFYGVNVDASIRSVETSDPEAGTSVTNGIVDDVGNPIYTVGSTYRANKIELIKLKIGDFVALDSLGEQGVVTLKVAVDLLDKDGNRINKIKTRYIPFLVDKSATSANNFCIEEGDFLAQAGAELICQSLGGSIANSGIYNERCVGLNPSANVTTTNGTVVNGDISGGIIENEVTRTGSCPSGYTPLSGDNTNETTCLKVQ